MTPTELGLLGALAGTGVVMVAIELATAARRRRRRRRASVGEGILVSPGQVAAIEADYTGRWVCPERPGAMMEVARQEFGLGLYQVQFTVNGERSPVIINQPETLAFYIAGWGFERE